MRGFGRTWPLKLFYTSNIPVILAAALLANMQLIGTFSVGAIPAGGTACGVLGCFDSNKQPLPGGIIYYLTAPKNLVLQALSIPFPGIAGSTTFEPS
jgi:preprotein translocase subunit SecY